MHKWDASMSAYLAMPSHSNIRMLFLLMEWSMHGIPWLFVAGFGTLYSIRLRQPLLVTWRWSTLLAGIMLDLVTVGMLKLAVQRSRPAYNKDDQVYEAPVADKYSFPSGHSSRSAMLAVMASAFLNDSNNNSFTFTTRNYLWAVVGLFPPTLGLSRVVMGRHYISDVLAGILLGMVEAIIAMRLPIALVGYASNLIQRFLLL